MKTNLYILIVFLLTVTLGNAQDTEKVVTEETAKMVTVENNDTVNNDLLIDATELKQTVARSSSDIRIYLNKERKVGNITLVFPEINKAVKA